MAVFITACKDRSSYVQKKFVHQKSSRAALLGVPACKAAPALCRESTMAFVCVPVSIGERGPYGRALGRSEKVRAPRAGMEKFRRSQA